MSELLFVDIHTLYDGVSKFCQTVLVCKVLEATGVGNFNGFPTPTKVDAPLGTYDNGSEAKQDWTNSYASVIGTIFYIASNTRSYIYFSFHRCSWFTHNTKVSHEMAVKRIYRYLQGTKNRGMAFNTGSSPRYHIVLHRISF